MITPEFLLTSLVIVLMPGTGALYTIGTGLTKDWKASLVAAFGCTLGIVPHLAASILGLSALLNMSARVFVVLKTVGAAYLLFMAWQTWRGAGNVKLSEAPSSEMMPARIAGKAIAINLLNPKLTLFFFAFLPLFVAKDAVSPVREMLGLSLVFMLMTFVVFALYGTLASAIRTYVVKSSAALRRFQKASALMFAAFAVKLALSEK